MACNTVETKKSLKFVRPACRQRPCPGGWLPALVCAREEHARLAQEVLCGPGGISKSTITRNFAAHAPLTGHQTGIAAPCLCALGY